MLKPTPVASRSQQRLTQVAMSLWGRPGYALPASQLLKLPEMQGVLRKGQQIEVRPGIITKDAEGRAACKPIFSRIMTLLAEQNELQYAVPGGLIGVGTTVSTRTNSTPGGSVAEAWLLDAKLRGCNSMRAALGGFAAAVQPSQLHTLA